MWKTANVVPIHKKASRSVLKNYRPVSLLSIISKVMETVVNSQVTNHLERHQLLTSHQFGFRRRLGTSDALQALHHAWVNAVGRNGAARILAVDIAGAFDRMSHVGVLHKARNAGITGPLHTWLSSYLSSRSLRCLVGGYTSTQYPITAGVSQGSILGPTLFLLYVNDAPSVLMDDAQLEAYADDTTHYSIVSNGSAAGAAHSLQLSIDRLHNWGQKWKIAASQMYNNALRDSGYNETVQFLEERRSGKKKKQRSRHGNITWLNPQFSKNVSTNFGQRFLQLVSKHFHKGCKL